MLLSPAILPPDQIQEDHCEARQDYHLCHYEKVNANGRVVSSKYKHCNDLRASFPEAPAVGCFSVQENANTKLATFEAAYCKVGKLNGQEKNDEINSEWTPLCYDILGKEINCQKVYNEFTSETFHPQTCGCYQYAHTFAWPGIVTFECTYRLSDGTLLQPEPKPVVDPVPEEQEFTTMPVNPIYD